LASTRSRAKDRGQEALVGPAEYAARGLLPWCKGGHQARNRCSLGTRVPARADAPTCSPSRWGLRSGLKGTVRPGPAFRKRPSFAVQAWGMVFFQPGWTVDNERAQCKRERPRTSAPTPP
jgi:hypothetical protein